MIGNWKPRLFFQGCYRLIFCRIGLEKEEGALEHTRYAFIPFLAIAKSLNRDGLCQETRAIAFISRHIPPILHSSSPLDNLLKSTDDRRPDVRHILPEVNRRKGSLRDALGGKLELLWTVLDCQ